MAVAVAPDGDGVTTMLDFYREHAISPVTQDVSDLSAHFARRAHLYRSLGIWSLKGLSVLEVGPGSGENALYTASLNPELYVLVEPNSTACEALRQRLPQTMAHVVPVKIDDYRHNQWFDVVICEGLLGLCGGNPLDMLDKVAWHVKIGGVLVITCIDPISDCAEVLRRALAWKYIAPSMPLKEKLDALVPVFTPHLSTLKGMTRSVEDWILDNILNPASIGPTFSIPDALSALDGRFELLGCSPRFLMDWRWYKDATPGLSWAIDAYWENAHNLFDYREIHPARTRAENEALMADCFSWRNDVADLERGQRTHVDTSVVEHDPGWFGRGQQYLSLVRTA